ESKTTIEHSKDSSSKLSVTGLWVKHGVPKLTKENERYIRYLVYICKKQGAYERYEKSTMIYGIDALARLLKCQRLGHVGAVELRRFFLR
ncbi:RNA-directed DNA polymerase, partial (plasmid) [Escherichia coli]